MKNIAVNNALNGAHYRFFIRIFLTFILFLALIVLCVTSTGLYAQTLLDKAKNDQVVNVAKEDTAMLAAFSKAKAGLDDFLEKAKNPEANTSNYFVKVGIQGGSDVEYFWIGDFENQGSVFKGVISNQARLIEGIDAGDEYEFNKEEIVDWMYVDMNKKRMFGNYSLCAILSKESPSNAIAVMKKYGLRCDN